MLNLFFKILKIAFLFFLLSSVLAVFYYKWMPVKITPLMAIRSIEHVVKGEPPIVHHKWVALDEMSRYMPVAVMASEDQQFLHHHGFDFGAIQDAAVDRLKGRARRGGSTISQQTVKNVFLWPSRSWIRKGFEAYFTVLIELLWSKERIMEVYLNSIEMGTDIYGVEAVAKQNFGCSALELRRGDCALIAATLPNPRRFSSYKPSSYVRKRQREIEHQMKFIPLISSQK
jgi:monofunctional biosynthetic peptidoglycan transglycosylase